MRLYNNATGALLASNDDACSLGSELTYTVTACGTYSIHEGCFSSSTCSGQVAIASSNAPTNMPTTTVPVGSTIACPTYSATNTISATQNYATCPFYACSGTFIIGVCQPFASGNFTGALLSVVLQVLDENVCVLTGVYCVECKQAIPICA